MLPLKESIKRPTITHICIFNVNSASFWHCYSLLGYYYTHARSKLLIHRVLEVRCFNFFNLRFNVLNNIKLLWLNNKTTLLLRSSFFGYCWDYCQRLIIFNPIRIAHPVLHSVQTNRRFVHFCLARNALIRANKWEGVGDIGVADKKPILTICLFIYRSTLTAAVCAWYADTGCFGRSERRSLVVVAAKRQLSEWQQTLVVCRLCWSVYDCSVLIL